MVNYEKLPDEDKILLDVYIEDSLTSGDISLLLRNCSIPYGSNLLKEMWGKHLLKRKKERKKKGGFRYRYTLSKTGEERVVELYKRGYS